MRTMPAEVTPVKLSERMFVLLFMFFAVMALAINVARITHAWFKFSARRDAFKEDMAYVRMHLRTTDCGSTLQKRSQAYDAEALTITERHNDAEAASVRMRGGIQVYNLRDHPQLDRGRSGLSDGSLVSLASILSHLQLSTRRRSHLTVLDDHCLFDLGYTALSKNTVVALECSEVLRTDRQRFHDVLRELADDQTQLMQMSGGSKRSSENGVHAQQGRGTDRVVRRSSILQSFVAGQVSV
ncbi:unnamed protein product [Prorocentrum cordatum]|uniref:Cyclic nucleotide-binding domain-containing protein n=1 Tax=Prorocentrum cordatum TaxID=2364126 RepID=A0ABN9SN92_9DINO|nr:unnamed protein product [Polarella glacialis]